jgi:hypothetical protein
VDEGNSWLLIILALVIFTMIDALFYGFGAAIQKIDQNELSKEFENGNKKAGKVLKILDNPTKFVNTIQITTSLMKFMAGSIMFFKMISKVYLKGQISFACIDWGCILIYIVCLIFMISFGMVVPKKLALENPSKWVYRNLSTIETFIIIFTPLTIIINFLSKAVLSLWGIDINKKEEEVTKENIINMIYAGQEEGTLEQENVEMINNIFELNDKKASEIMTNRKNLVCIDGEQTLKDVADFILNKGSNSRYPVYIDDIDNIVGILNMKDALIYRNKEKYNNTPITKINNLIREAHYIPETRNIDNLFKEMQSEKTHMVIVVDEYGQTSGIVTLEDILEEIVGNIMDEYDVDENMIVSTKDGGYVMKGMTPIDEVEKVLDITFDEEDDDFETLNGFLINKLERIPNDGEKFSITYGGYEFKALRVAKRIIQNVKINKVKQEVVNTNKEDLEQEDLEKNTFKNKDLGVKSILSFIF